MSNQGKYGAAAWYHKASTDLSTLVDQLGFLGRSEIAVFGVNPKSVDTRCYTHLGLTLEFCLVASQLSIGTKFGGKIGDIEIP